MTAPTVTYDAHGFVTVAVSAAAGVVLGDVTLKVDGGTAVSMSLASGAATFDVGVLNAGAHTLDAEYAAQGNFAASSNTSTTLTVNQASVTVTYSAS